MLSYFNWIAFLLCFLGSLGASHPKPESDNKENSISNRLESLTIQEDVKEGEVEDEEGLTIHPYESLTTTSSDPASDIDVTKREVIIRRLNHVMKTYNAYNQHRILMFEIWDVQAYLSSTEFREKFGMAKDAFYKLPKWKQNKLKMALNLF